MANKAPGRRIGGRPPIEDRANLRRFRLAFRVHEDLNQYVTILAEQSGDTRTRWVEKLLIAEVNSHYPQDVVDGRGREIPEDKRGPPATGARALRRQARPRG